MRRKDHFILEILGKSSWRKKKKRKVFMEEAVFEP